MLGTADTPEYDPRYDRAQTVDGAQARYVSHETDYSLVQLEADIDRILRQGEYPDRTTPRFEGQEILRC